MIKNVKDTDLVCCGASYRFHSSSPRNHQRTDKTCVLQKSRMGRRCLHEDRSHLHHQEIIAAQHSLMLKYRPLKNVSHLNAQRRSRTQKQKWRRKRKKKASVFFPSVSPKSTDSLIKPPESECNISEQVKRLLTGSAVNRTAMAQIKTPPLFIVALQLCTEWEREGACREPSGNLLGVHPVLSAACREEGAP